MNLLKKFLPVIVVLLLSFWTVKPLFNSGFFPMHDDTQVARVFEMKRSLSDGMFPVRWVADLGYGYGYPIFNFYAPLAYYVGGFLNLVGFNSLISTKIMMGIGIVASGVFMYLFAREFWGEKGGIISGLLYLYAPYHALNIYVRGDVAEFWAYAVIPLVFFGVYKIFLALEGYADLVSSSKFKVQSSKLWYWVCVTAISYSSVILSHNLTAMMATPFIFVFAFILYIKLRMGKKIHKPYFILLGLLLGILLSAFYWLPVFPELSFTNVLSVVGGGSDYKDHFVCLQQLWSSQWGFGGSIPGCIDGLSFKIGKIHVLLSILSIPALIFLYKKNKIQFSITTFFVIALSFSIFLTLSQSKFLWDSIPHMAFFQFPWRFLLLISFFMSFLGGASIWILEETKFTTNFYKYSNLIIVVVAASIIVIFNSKVFVPSKITNIKVADLTSKNTLTWTVSKISDEYMPNGFAYPISPKDLPSGKIHTNKDIKTSLISEKTQKISFITDSKKEANLVINLAYFPAWHVFIDHKQVEFRYFIKGLVVKVPEGKHTIDIVFVQTGIEKLGNALTLIGILFLVLGIIAHRKNERYA